MNLLLLFAVLLALVGYISRKGHQASSASLLKKLNKRQKVALLREKINKLDARRRRSEN